MPNADRRSAPPPDAGPGTLFIVSTPIGNLEDVSHRAIRILGEVAAVLCEDTRHSRTLLERYDLATRTEALHEHNEVAATPGLLRRLASGESMALISDAGTPLLSDPGARFVQGAIEAGITVVPVPGASALLAAVVGSGLGGGPFTFLGFLARKGAERQRQLGLISRLPHPSVVYEAPGRVLATLEALEESGLGERRVAVGRELTKQFEEFVRGTVTEVAEYYRRTAPRGEVVIVVDGGGEDAGAVDPAVVASAASAMRERGERPRDIARTLVERYGMARNDAYRLALGE